MSFKRRRFLILGGLSGLGLAVLGRQSLRPGQTTTATTPEITPLQVATPTGQPLLRFAAIADTGSGDRNQFAVGQAMAQYRDRNPYDLVVLAGDNIYNSGEMSRIQVAFEEPYQQLLQAGVKFRAGLGNHDIRTENGDPQVRYPGFNMQGRFYSYVAESAQFFVLDTNGNADWKGQMAWLERELSQSQAQWKVVYGHHPIYSSGHYGTNSEFVKLFTPLFKKYRVQLYINGHEHDYERSQPIDGTTYLVTGIGGATLRPVGKSKWTAASTSRFGFSAIELYQDRLVIQGIGTNNSVFDTGTISI
ncbi:MAG: metallophosphoesterase [Alkalinema sp. CACIAM 70d]|nr:MAG: metallophosphoesterase [Alkalinema sp. CACIAM 70d]